MEGPVLHRQQLAVPWPSQPLDRAESWRAASQQGTGLHLTARGPRNCREGPTSLGQAPSCQAAVSSSVDCSSHPLAPWLQSVEVEKPLGFS